MRLQLHRPLEPWLAKVYVHAGHPQAAWYLCGLVRATLDVPLPEQAEVSCPGCRAAVQRRRATRPRGVPV